MYEGINVLFKQTTAICYGWMAKGKNTSQKKYDVYFITMKGFVASVVKYCDAHGLLTVVHFHNKQVSIRHGVRWG